jgi:transcriptional regulator with XRE-family HTH domain
MDADAGDGRTDTVEVKKRRLRGALRQARLDAGMTQKAAAEKLVWSASKIVRIEQGTVPVTPSDVRVLLHLYGTEDDSGVEGLVALAKDAREDKGWGPYGDILSQYSLELFGNEPAAKVIYKYEPSVVPGLFQTQEYARFLLKALGISEDQIDRRLEVRAQRQMLLESPARPDISFIIGEAAFIRPVGNVEIMREQITHILGLAKLDRISVLLLPFSAGAHRGMGSAFTVLQFEDALLPDLLYLENAERESISRDEAGEIRRFLELFDDLQEMATKSGSLEEQVKGILRERYGEGDNAK